MLHHSRAIPLRNIKYGETSIVSTIYTELFGIQSYLIPGVRTDKKSTVKANLYATGNLLDLVVYHHPHKKLQRIKEVKINRPFHAIHYDMVKNAIMIFICELVYRTIDEPESYAEQFDFVFDTLVDIDERQTKQLAYAPINFLIEWCQFLGFGITDNEYKTGFVLDLQDGQFKDPMHLLHPFIVTVEQSYLLKLLLEKKDVSYASHSLRVDLLNTLLQYLYLHLPSMTVLKSPLVLHTVLDA